MRSSEKHFREIQEKLLRQEFRAVLHPHHSGINSYLEVLRMEWDEALYELLDDVYKDGVRQATTSDRG